MSRDELLGVVRHVLTAAGGALAADGVFNSSYVPFLVGAGVFVAGAIWSVLQKRGFVR